MDLVTDLTAEAVSYITLIQDICKSKLPERYRVQPESFPLWELFDRETMTGDCNPLQTARIAELVWSSNGNRDKETLRTIFFQIAADLLHWLDDYIRPGETSLVNRRNDANLNATPDFWRQELRAILYDRMEARTRLVYTLRYMPLQVVLAVAVHRPKLYRQRLFQVMEPPPAVPSPGVPMAAILSGADIDRARHFWSAPPDASLISLLPDLAPALPPLNLREVAFVLLVNDELLLQVLLARKIALPFDGVFRMELEEVRASRKHRLPDPHKTFKIPLPDEAFVIAAAEPVSAAPDPQRRAAQMKLAGLAFSGGGIRSATFNLGLLQKLANLGVLERFDYLSTVSGGGYIGSWLAAWIRQSGSLAKVERRLDPEKSGDPLGEEVRPIRWLRMYSNYLSPNASIMSADAWTMGITWLRNTLINQFILLLLLLTVLGAIGAVYQGWIFLGTREAHPDWWRVVLWSEAMLTPAAFMAGAGMRDYDRLRPPQSRFNLFRSDILPHVLVAWAVLCACALSAWFYIALPKAPLSDKLRLLWPAGLVILQAMGIISQFGGYHLTSVGGAFKPARRRRGLWPAIALSSIAASAAGYVLIALAWQGMCALSRVHPYVTELPEKLKLILGVPLVLEAIAVTVVVRMALMGDYFPDERREWWGRVGALLHRCMLIWIVVSACSLILPDYLRHISVHWLPRVPALLGGWSVIIGYAVKLAYQPGSDPAKKNGPAARIEDLFVRLAPYLFMVGFLLIGAAVLNTLRGALEPLFAAPLKNWSCLLVTLALAAITGLLSWRVGVNEFSLHDFYRNRLVRAYLGATRRRTDRENSANSFTGFDKDDDYPLADLRTAEHYYGPFPLVNTALNATVVTDLDRQDRKAESFVFSPLFCGFDFNPTRSAAYQHGQNFEYGYRPTEHYSADGGPLAGTAMAISGAAVNPNMGYHSSPGTAFLLTIFNVRLGRWIGNPAGKRWHRSDPVAGVGYLVQDLAGSSAISANYVNLSDGGHFDNMGLYELVRRRCSFIVLGDAEEDAKSTCEGLANAIRRCRIDFGADIRIPGITDITRKDAEGFAKQHFTLGKIHYAGRDKLVGDLLYIKTSVTTDLSVDIREYLMNNSEFPQQSTGDQFFDEAQFESYRNLGYHSI